MSIIDDISIYYYPAKIWIVKPIGKVTLRQFIKSHRSPKEKIKRIFNKIAKAEREESWERKGKLKQENLFYFTPCVNLDGEGRSYTNIQSFNGLMVLDFDHLKCDAAKFRDRLFNNIKSIITAYVSPSGKGVKCIVKIPKVTTVDEYKAYFYGMAFKMKDVESFDGAYQNPVLPLFISWDSGIRYRENPETWTVRGGKTGGFKEWEGDIDVVENIGDDDKKDVLQQVYRVIKKADKDKCGHPNVVKSACIMGGYVISQYIDQSEAEQYLMKWIDDSPYLSAKANTYKTTAITMLEKGKEAPLYLEKHKQKREKKTADNHTQFKKSKTGYYLLSNLTKFKVERTKENPIFGNKSIKIKEL